MKPSFFHNVDLLELSPLHRLLFCGMWCWADRDGRLIDRPKQLKHDILPMDDCDVESMLNDLKDRGFIVRYEVDGQKCLEIINFDKHQNPHPKEVSSVLPGPATESRVITLLAVNRTEPAGLSPFPSVTLQSVTSPLSPHHADPGEDVASEPASQEEPDEQPLGFMDMLHRYVRRKGLKKPPKAILAKAEPMWEKTAVGDTICDAALDGFHVNDWWKTANEPLLGFVKNPREWIPPYWSAADAQRAAGSAEAAETPTGGTASPQPAVARNWLEEWNRLVPEQPTEYNPKKNVKLTVEATDPEFRDNFEKICAEARAAIAKKGKEASYLTIYWLCSTKDGEQRPNWWRMLFGDLQHMGALPGAKSNIGGPWKPGMPIETEETTKEYRAWQVRRIAKGKHGDPDRAAAEGEIDD